MIEGALDGMRDSSTMMQQGKELIDVDTLFRPKHRSFSKSLTAKKSLNALGAFSNQNKSKASLLGPLELPKLETAETQPGWNQIESSLKVIDYERMRKSKPKEIIEQKERFFNMYNRRSHASFDDIPMVASPVINLAMKAKKILRAKQVAKANVELENRAAE